MSFEARITDKVLAPTEIVDSMADIVAHAKKESVPRKQQQLEANQSVWLSMKAAPVSAAELNNIKAGKSHLYAFIVLRFLDDSGILWPRRRKHQQLHQHLRAEDLQGILQQSD